MSVRERESVAGLPNGAVLTDLLRRAFKRSERRSEYLFALLVIGLDRSHSAGNGPGAPGVDPLMTYVARRLQASLRATDAISPEEREMTLGRLDGDEFTVLLEDIKSPGDASLVADRLRDALLSPFDIHGHEIYLSAGIGIAVSSAGYQQPEDMVRDASAAMHRAKTAGAEGRGYSRLEVETNLRQAVSRDSFLLHYQPIVAITTGRIEAFEALVRWRHPRRGILGPAEFMKIAEDAGIFGDIERMTLKAACRQMQTWRQEYGPLAPDTICVNVSSGRMVDDALSEEVADVLHDTQLPARHLKIEITENVLISDMAAARRTLSRLRALGVRCSLDDFGTGYSSLSYVDQLTVDTLKLDRSFISRLDPGQAVSETVRTIVKLGHALDMDIVAEGIECEEQLNTLRTLGCDYAQGFHFSPAVPAADATVLIEKQPWLGTPSTFVR